MVKWKERIMIDNRWVDTWMDDEQIWNRWLDR